METSTTLKGDYISFENFSKIISLSSDAFYNIKNLDNSSYIPGQTTTTDILNKYIDYINMIKSNTTINSNIIFNIKSNITLDLNYDTYIKNETKREIFILNFKKEIEGVIESEIYINKIIKGSIIVDYTIININNLKFNQILTNLLKLYQIHQTSDILSNLNKNHLPNIMYICENNILTNISACDEPIYQSQSIIYKISNNSYMIAINMIVIIIIIICCICPISLIVYYKYYKQNKKVYPSNIDINTISIELENESNYLITQ